MGGNNSSTMAEKAERDLLDSGKKWYASYKQERGHGTFALEGSYSQNVPCRNIEDEHIRTVSYKRETPTDTDAMKGKDDKQHLPIVIMHGYASGLGIYYSSLPGIAERHGSEVFAIDNPGSGLSSRPKWTLGVGEKVDVDECEKYFTDRLEAWRETMQLDKFILVGHSMGGYLATSYSEKYPERVEKLLLVSPCGVPPKPVEDEGAEKKKLPFMFRMARTAWKNGWSPMHLTSLGVARRVLDGYTDRRFESFDWVDKPGLTEYFFRNWANGHISAGGYLHSTLFEPGAYAKRPLIDRIPYLKLTYVGFVYGASDWMDIGAAHAVKQACDQIQRQGMETPHGPGVAPKVEVCTIDGAGHNMMVDNPIGFTESIFSMLSESINAHQQVYGTEENRQAKLVLRQREEEEAERQRLKELAAKG